MSAEIYEMRIWCGYVKAQLYAVAGSDKMIARPRSRVRRVYVIADKIPRSRTVVA